MEAAALRWHRLRSSGAGRALPYLFLAPALLTVFGLFFYPLFDGIRASFQGYRFGNEIGGVGLENYRDVIEDPVFRQSLWTTVKFIALVVALETTLGLLLALAVFEEGRLVRLVRTTLIVPMVLMPVVVGIVFRLLYASDVGLLTTVSGSSVEILSKPTTAFLGIVVMDVWQWTPLMFLIALAGLQSLPSEPLEAARVDGASGWRCFWDVMFPMLRPILGVAIVLRTVDAFGTFDQVFILTQGGPARATELVSLFGYETMFKFQQLGFAAAAMVTVGLVVTAAILVMVKLLRAREATV